MKKNNFVMSKGENIYHIVMIIICVISAILINTVFSPCENGMKCVKETKVCTLFLMVIALISLVTVIGRFGIIAIPQTLFTLLFGTVVYVFCSGCKIDTMRCHVYTLPYLKVISVVICLANIVNVIYILNTWEGKIKKSNGLEEHKTS